MACVLRMRMLRVEERQGRIDFRFVRRHVFADFDMMRPIGADERIAFDDLLVDALPLLMEADVPRGLDILHDGRLETLLALLLRVCAVAPSDIVVVALDEELLDVAAIRSLVVWEDLIPRGGKLLKLLQLSRIRDIASDQDDIDTLRVIPSQCLLPHVRCFRVLPNMNIADDADAQFRNDDFLLIRAKQPHAAERRKRRSGKQTLQKISSGEIEHVILLLSI